MLRKLKTYRDAPREAQKLAEELEKGQSELAAIKGRLALWRERAEKAEAKINTEPFDASRLVWIFGAGRTGSSWLASVMGELAGHEVWFEPLVGELFGYHYYVRGTERHRESRHFVLGVLRDAWIGTIRSCVLEGAVIRFPNCQRLIIKEPNGSIGAPLLAEALPESHMIVLLRDPRDVAASSLDALKRGGGVTGEIPTMPEHYGPMKTPIDW